MGIYHDPLPADYFSAFSFCLDCCVWVGLSVVWEFVVSLNCGGSSLWVGLDKWVVKISWLEKLVLVFLWVRWISSLWSAIKCPVVSFEVSVGLVWLLATCILMLRAVFLHCWRISVVCLALELVGSCVELGFSVSMEAFCMSSCRLMFPGVRSFLVFSSFRFKPPASGFQSYSYSSLKTSPSIQHRW